MKTLQKQYVKEKADQFRAHYEYHFCFGASGTQTHIIFMFEPTLAEWLRFGETLPVPFRPQQRRDRGDGDER